MLHKNETDAAVTGPNRLIFDVFIFVFIYVVPGSIVVYSYSVTGCRLLTDQLSSLRHEGGTTCSSPPPTGATLTLTFGQTSACSGAGQHQQPRSFGSHVAATTKFGESSVSGGASGRSSGGEGRDVDSGGRGCRCRRAASETRRLTPRSSVSEAGR